MRRFHLFRRVRATGGLAGLPLERLIFLAEREQQLADVVEFCGGLLWRGGLHAPQQRQRLFQSEHYERCLPSTDQFMPGRETVNVVPAPRALSTSTVPPSS